MPSISFDTSLHIILLAYICERKTVIHYSYEAITTQETNDHKAIWNIKVTMFNSEQDCQKNNFPDVFVLIAANMRANTLYNKGWFALITQSTSGRFFISHKCAALLQAREKTPLLVSFRLLRGTKDSCHYRPCTSSSISMYLIHVSLLISGTTQHNSQ